MIRGLYILALGHSSYAHWAVNLAASVRFHSPTLHITLLHDGLYNKIPEDERIFDKQVKIIPEHYTGKDGRFQPGLAKLNLYHYFEHQENIYIDVDSILINEIDWIFETCKDINIGLQVYKRTHSSEENWGCMWANWEMLKAMYKLPSEFTLSEINSSFIYSKKNKEAKKFWDQAAGNYIEGYKTRWGERFPDELAFNVATAQTNMSGEVQGFHSDRPVLMHSKTGAKNCKITELKDIAPILSYWGGRLTTHVAHQNNYRAQADKVHKAVFNKSNPYKIEILLKNKIVQKDGVQLNVKNTNNEVLRKF